MSVARAGRMAAGACARRDPGSAGAAMRNEAAKEISTRFDFRGVGARISWSGETVEIRANSEDRAKAVLDVFKDKLVRRGVSLKALDPGDPKPSGKEFRLSVGLKQGITQDDAKKI